MTSAIPSLRKAAILLRSLDGASAEQLLSELEPACAEALTAEAARLDEINPEEQHLVVEELKQLWIRQPGDRACTSRLPGASGEAGNRDLPVPCVAAPAPADSGHGRRLRAGDAFAGKQEGGSAPAASRASNAALFSSLKNVPLHTLCSAIRQEQPRVIALVLSHLPAGRAAKVLENLPEPLQHEVVRFMTTPQAVQHALAEQIEARLRLRIETAAASGPRQSDGVTLAARLLNRTTRTTAGRILAGLEREDPELAARLHRRRWNFDDLVDLDEGLLGITVGHMEPADLALALKGASPQLRKRCFRLLPKRVARHVKGHMKSLGTVRLSDIETAQAYLITLLEEVSSASGTPSVPGG
jgi:flagellar motor switch protein FliG